MEDIRLGRKLNYRETRVTTVISTTRLLIAANPLRTRLIIGCNTNTDYFIGSNDLQPTSSAGIRVALARDPIIMRVEDWGKWLQGDIFVNDAGQVKTFTVIEEELDKE